MKTMTTAAAVLAGVTVVAGALAAPPERTLKVDPVELVARRVVEAKPESQGEGAAYVFSVIRNVSVPFGSPDPNKPNVASTIFRTVQDLTGGRYYFESTYAPNVVWIDMTKLDFTAGKPEMELQIEKKIFSLNGDVTNQLANAKPFVFGMNTPSASKP